MNNMQLIEHNVFITFLAEIFWSYKTKLAINLKDRNLKREKQSLHLIIVDKCFLIEYYHFDLIVIHIYMHRFTSLEDQTLLFVLVLLLKQCNVVCLDRDYILVLPDSPWPDTSSQ